MKKSLFRKYTTMEYPSFEGWPPTIETRSLPWTVWLIDRWFLWAHEWLWLINKGLFHKLMYPFCVAYDIYIHPWVNGYERIDELKDKYPHD